MRMCDYAFISFVSKCSRGMFQLYAVRHNVVIVVDGLQRNMTPAICSHSELKGANLATNDKTFRINLPMAKKYVKFCQGHVGSMTPEMEEGELIRFHTGDNLRFFPRGEAPIEAMNFNCRIGRGS